MQPKRQEWRALLAGGFAGMDAPFAGHPCDERRARKMYFAAMRENVTDDEIIDAAAIFLASHARNPATIPDQISRVERFIKSIRPTKRKKSAWLITWEHVGDNKSDIPGGIIAIRDGRTSAERVKEFVEHHYIAVYYSVWEKAHYSSHQKDNPYPAEYHRLPDGGVWLAGITCGHNPFIYARFVKNLRIYQRGAAGTALVWDDVVRAGRTMCIEIDAAAPKP